MAIKQTKYKSHNTIKRRPLLIVGLILLMTATSLAVVKILASTNHPTESNNNEVVSQTEHQNNEQSEPETPEYDGKIPSQYEGDNPNDLEYLTGYISYSDVSNDQLSIRAVIDQFVSGTCDLTLKSNGKTVTRSSKIINNASASACKGFDIPTSELSSGSWEIIINLAGENNKTGTISGVIEI